MKKCISVQQAGELFHDGARIMVGGFGLVGCPLTLVRELLNREVIDLEIISNNLGEPGRGLGELVRKKQVKKGIGSYFTSNPEVSLAFQRGEIEIELLPQGTLSEAIRAGGAGIAGFFTAVGAGTDIAKGKEEKWFAGKKYILQECLRADIALIKASKADKLGNLVYEKSARNFNPIMATAADIVIAEVEQIVETGQLSAEEIVTPHLFVDYIVVQEGLY